MSRSFELVLQEFATVHGLPPEGSAFGLEFECEGLIKAERPSTQEEPDAVAQQSHV